MRLEWRVENWWNRSRTRREQDRESAEQLFEVIRALLGDSCELVEVADRRIKAGVRLLLF